MKTYVTYGFFMALGGMLLTLALYFLGFHDDPSKLSSAKWVANCGLLAICITVIALGMKARRAEMPAAAEFSYGSAFFAGFMISVFAALFNIVTTYLYAAVINPHFVDVIMQAQADAMEAKGLSSDKIEQIQKMTAWMMKPAIQSVFAAIFTVIFGTIISLVAAAFTKRQGTEEPPPAAA